MSYSTDPVRDADSHLTRVHNESVERASAEMLLASDFAADFLARPMTAPTTTGQKRNDYEHKNGVLAITERAARVGEVIADSLDYSQGPELDDVFALIQRAAHGQDIQADARSLIARAAAVFAFHAVES